MLKPCDALTPDEREMILQSIRAGRVYWPYRNASHNGTLTLQDVETHGQIDAERGVVVLGGIEMRFWTPTECERQRRRDSR